MTPRHPVARLAGGLILWICLGLAFRGATQTPSLRAVVTTNFIIVTNIVLVTNYVAEPDVPPTSAPPPIPPSPPSSKQGNSSLPDISWVPPQDDFDWIQLKTGEWLKGRIKAMQKRELEFYSEKLEDLSFDWKDIRQLRSARKLDVLFTDGEERSGPVRLSPGLVAVGDEEPRAATRDEVQSLTPSGSRERDYWSGKGTLGLTLRAGNTEQFEYNSQAHIQRRTPTTRLALDYIGNVSSSSGIENANNHRINSEFDLWLSRRFYLILPFGEYYKDRFQNLADRLTLGAGVGFDLVEHRNIEWNITTGPAFQKAWFYSSPPGEESSKAAAALTFGSRFDWHINRLVEWILEYRGQYTRRAIGETTHHSVSTLSFELTHRFDLDLTFVWDRIAYPKINADGTTPQPDDFRLVVGLGLDF